MSSIIAELTDNMGSLSQKHANICVPTNHRLVNGGHTSSAGILECIALDEHLAFHATMLTFACNI